MAKLLRVIEIETDEDQRYCAGYCPNRHDGDLDSFCCGDSVEYERDESGTYRYRRTQACKQDSLVFPNVTEIPPGRLVAKAIWDYLCSLSGFGLASLATDDQATWWDVTGKMARFIIHGYYVARSAEESLNRQCDGELSSKYEYACESLRQYRAALGFDAEEVTREMVLDRIRQLVAP